MTSLSTKLAEREASGKPIQIGLIGAGKFGSMLYVNNSPPTKDQTYSIGKKHLTKTTQQTASPKPTAPPACA